MKLSVRLAEVVVSLDVFNLIDVIHKDFLILLSTKVRLVVFELTSRKKPNGINIFFSSRPGRDFLERLQIVCQVTTINDVALYGPYSR